MQCRYKEKRDMNINGGLFGMGEPVAGGREKERVCGRRMWLKYTVCMYERL
jgi:hypothetical protein